MLVSRVDNRKLGRERLITMTVAVLYLIDLVIVYFVTGQWVYNIMAVLPLAGKAIFMLSGILLVLAAHQMGAVLSRTFHAGQKTKL